MMRGFSGRGTVVVAAAALSSVAAAQPCAPYWELASVVPRRPAAAMVTFDDGSGPAIYIRTGGGAVTGELLRMRQDGAWELVEDGLRPSHSFFAPVLLDDGTGPALHVLGTTHMTTHLEYWIARWDGQQWNHVWPGMYSCDGQWCKGPALSVDVGDGMAIYGVHRRPSSIRGILRWDGFQWVEIGEANGGLSVHAFDLGNGPGLYALGSFTTIGGVQSRGFARWTGLEWIDLSHPEYSVGGSRSTVVYDDGGGPAIYTLNHTTHLNQSLLGVKRWTGNIWEVVGQATIPGGTLPVGYSNLHVFDDGTGPGLYVSGEFHNINGVPARNIARYDEHGWSAVGQGFFGADHMGSLDMDRGPSLIVSQSNSSTPVHMGRLVGCPNCYANCDQSKVQPILNVDDFTCFINEFAQASTMLHVQQVNHYANCDGSTTAPVLNVDDFVCFISEFAAGCE